MRTNPMKAKLLAGAPALGVSVMIPSPQVVEMLGVLGFDWVLLDLEHGTIDLESLELMCLAAEASGIVAIARPPSNAAADIARVMDRGVLGVQVPHVSTAADARRAVEAVKFHPQGLRGLAQGTRPSRYGFGGSMQAYCEAANRETLVCVQLEDAQAIRNAEEILEVDGVDVFFIGPSDLSQSMGFPGDPGAPPVREAIESTLARIVARGRIPGMPAGTGAVAGAVRGGVRYLYTHLPKLVGEGAGAFLEAARDRPDAP